MLTKASLMGDEEIFHEIEKAADPKSCKALGRGVRNFDQALWDRHLDEIGFEVVLQKFASNRQLREVLLSTGNKVLAEAAPNDGRWGIGLPLSDDRIYDQSQWCGRNVLGFSLMRVRNYLRGDAVPLGIPTNSTAASTTSPADDSIAKVATSPDEDDTAAPEAPAASEEQECNGLLIEDAADQEDFLRPITDLDAVRECYERYGVVGVTGVLSPEEVQQLLADGIESCLPDGCRMDDPTTYHLADSVMNRFGVIGKSALFNPAILAARTHPNVVAAYATVHGREDVVACHDRFAWMRPAAQNPAWNTPFSWPGLHVDVDLHNYYNGSRSDTDAFLRDVDFAGGNFVAENNAKHHSMGRTVQGVLNLLDNQEEDGGFQCVPGMFGNKLEEWASSHPGISRPGQVNGRYDFKGFGADAKMGGEAVRIPCPAGTLILFDATLPHGTRPNASMNSRAILFLRYLTSDELPAKAWRQRNAALQRIVKKVDFDPSKRQLQHLLGPENEI